jgi:peptidoglycan/xylan/chitin deacetylase (PgdA/CDA1 family)
MNIVAKIQAKLRIKWKYAYNDIRSILGMNERLFKRTPGARIVAYHGICMSDHTRFNSIFLGLKTFVAHLQFYNKYFNVISLDDFYNHRFSKEKFNICITFDDGFANNYKYVLPLINKYCLPVTFFITGIRDTGGDILWNDFLALAQKYGPAEFDFLNDQFYKNKYKQYVSRINNKSLKNLLHDKGFADKAALINLLEPEIPFKHNIKEKDYWLQMTKNEIMQLSASPFATIGCHGYYHNDLSKIPANDARDELVHAKRFLENITGREINAIAFPYGSYTPEVVAQAKFAGFNKLLATDFLFQNDYSDPYMRDRLTINPYISLNNQMIAIINGKYQQ